MDPTLPRPVTPAERERDAASARLARRWSAAHVTPAEAGDWFSAAMLGVGFACLLVGGSALAGVLYEHADELMAMVMP